MPCLNPDGTITEQARALLRAAGAPVTPEELAVIIGQPLFRVRSSLRELSAAGLVEQAGDRYSTTAKGAQKTELAA